MKVVVIDNAHLYKTPDGKFYSTSIYGNYFFQRYLDVFEKVRFVSKVKHVQSVDFSNVSEINLENLEIFELNWYQGLKEMLKVFPSLIKKYYQIGKGSDCYIYRVAQIESFISYLLRTRKKPFALEVVNDPTTFLEMSKISRYFSIKLLKRMVKKANGVSYVTERYLQSKYPSKSIKFGETSKYFHSNYSSVELDSKDIQTKGVVYDSTTLNIVHISNAISGNIKGHKTLIEIVDNLYHKGYSVHCTIIGDGTDLDYYKKMVDDKGLHKVFHFTGRINNKRVIFDIMRNSHVFIYPTQMEGLPRALIEAMSCGLACISTSIAGIPELLDKDFIFDFNDVNGFVDKTIELIKNPEHITLVGSKNAKKAREFTTDVLSKKRKIFYSKLRYLTSENAQKVEVSKQ